MAATAISAILMVMTGPSFRAERRCEISVPPVIAYGGHSQAPGRSHHRQPLVISRIAFWRRLSYMSVQSRILQRFEAAPRPGAGRENTSQATGENICPKRR